MPRPRLLQVLMLLAANLAVAVDAACVDDVQRCARLTDDLARLECYDQVARRLAGTNAQPQADASAAAVSGTATTANRPSSPSHVTAPPPATPGADFGLSEAAKQARDPEKAKQDSISAGVAAVARRLTGEMVVTLADGQVWAQLDPDTRAKVKVGDTVTIRRAALGSYLLVTPSGIATRVKRLK